MASRRSGIACLLEPQVAFEDFLNILADQQLVEVLQVRQAIEEEDALDQPVGMLHLVDRFIVFVLPSLVTPQWRSMRACRKYWLMAVSSFFRTALRCCNTVASPRTITSRERASPLL